MLGSIKTYIYDRRQGLSTAAGFVGGLYMAKGYLNDRLEEAQAKMAEERGARDALRRRFSQTQEDVSYTVLALLPTLSEQILSQMDVEALTKELQALSRVRAAAAQVGPSPILYAPQPTIPVPALRNLVQKNQSEIQPVEKRPLSGNSSVDIVGSRSYLDERSGGKSGGASQRSSISFDEINASSILSASGVQSWVDGSVAAPAGRKESPWSPATHSITGSSPAGDSVNGDRSRLSESILSVSATSDISNASSSTRTKTELWNEVKMLTFTRTLTTLYSSTLLTLLTTLQLTLLARSKYVHSVLQRERDERMHEQFEAQLTVTNLFFQGLGGKGLGLPDDLEKFLLGGVDDDDPGEDEDKWAIGDDLENKYLTLSWWLLHVGWKDVGERVRRAVEEAFDGVSLKTRLAAVDLHRLINDVRRRVEYEITFEGTERRINFLSTLLPPTPETIQHVLTQGGYTSSPPTMHHRPHDRPLESSASLTSSQLSHNFFDSPALGLSNMRQHPSQTIYQPPPPLAPDLDNDRPFAALVSETRAIVSSADFERVLEVCLDRATEVMLGGLEKGVFGTGQEGDGQEDVRIRLAALLPNLAKWSRDALNGLPNELIDALLVQKEVPCLSAIVFGKFEERFR